MNKQHNNAGWIVTFAALGINLILGILYSWSILKKALVAEWGWSNTEASLPYTVCIAVLAFVTIFGGRLQDKYGPRIIALIGGLLFGAGLIGSAYAKNPTIMVLTFGVISGLGMGFGYAAATPCAIKWFDPRKKGLISGIVVSGIGLSAVYIAPLTNQLLAVSSIQQAFLFLGILSIVAMTVFSLILRNPPVGYVPAVSPNKPASSHAADFRWQDMIKTRPFILLWLTYLMSATAGLMLIGHIASIAMVQAHWQAGFILVVILAVFNATGRISGGFLSDKVGRTNAMLIAFGLQAVNMFVFALFNSIPLLIAGTAIAGLAYGSIFSLFPAITADFFGIKNLGVNYGIIFTGWGVAGVIGPIIGGRVADMTGTYNGSYIVAGVMLVIGVLLVKLIKAPKGQSVGR
ncbi:MAG TPA: oxalate:formate antiporter [Bacteroidales bacterium]|nr:MAG: putative MFS-type transporter YhjX [Bacteroidetes bacterium ADurb.Bin416]HBL71572.1 oxalate:formate antiporter [Bacteroidales bacterium]